LAALAFSLGAGAAFAQTAFVAPSLNSAPTTRETQIDVSTDLMYDSNIARSDRRTAAARGLSLADEIATPEVNFTVARQFGRDVLFVQGFGSYLFHRSDPVLDRENIGVAGGFNGHVLLCQELLTGAYARQQSDLADQSRVVVANVVETKSVALSADCGGPVGFAPTASITQTWRDNSAEQYIPNNSNTLATSGGLTYRRPEFGALTFFGHYSRTDFPFGPVLVELSGQRFGFGYEAYGAGVAFDRHLGGRIEGVGQISYSAVDPSTPLLKTFRGLTYSADVIYHLNPLTDIHLSAIRATSPSNRIEADYSIDQTYQADVTYTFGPRLSVSVIGFRRTQKFQIASTATATDLTQTILDSVTAAATYLITRHFSLTLHAGDEERSANFPGLSYSSTRVGITIKATY
jgi:hypothetical protein